MFLIQVPPEHPLVATSFAIVFGVLLVLDVPSMRSMFVERTEEFDNQPSLIKGITEANAVTVLRDPFI